MANSSLLCHGGNVIRRADTDCAALDAKQAPASISPTLGRPTTSASGDVPHGMHFTYKATANHAQERLSSCRPRRQTLLTLLFLLHSGLRLRGRNGGTRRTQRNVRCAQVGARSPKLPRSILSVRMEIATTLGSLHPQPRLREEMC